MTSRILVVDDEPAVTGLISYNLRKAHYEVLVSAGEKAQDLVEAAGAEAGCMVSINENTRSFFNSGWYGREDNLWTQNVIQNAAPAGGRGGQFAFGPVNVE